MLVVVLLFWLLVSLLLDGGNGVLSSLLMLLLLLTMSSLLLVFGFFSCCFVTFPLLLLLHSNVALSSSQCSCVQSSAFRKLPGTYPKTTPMCMPGLCGHKAKQTKTRPSALSLNVLDIGSQSDSSAHAAALTSSYHKEVSACQKRYHAVARARQVWSFNDKTRAALSHHDVGSNVVRWNITR